MALLPAWLVAIVARLGLSSITGAGLIAGGSTLIGGIFAFIATPLGRIVLAAVLCVVAFMWGDIHRGGIERERCQAKIEKLIADAEADKNRLRVEIRGEVAAEIDRLKREAAELQRKVDDYEKTLPKNDACRLSPDDVRRLRGL